MKSLLRLVTSVFILLASLKAQAIVSSEECRQFSNEASKLEFVISENAQGGSYGKEEIEALRKSVTAKPQLINCFTEYGDTPLTTALRTGSHACPNIRVANFLLDLGANSNMADRSFDLTPLYYAIEAYGLVFGSPRFLEGSPGCSSRSFAPVEKVTLERLITRIVTSGGDLNRRSKNNVSIQERAAKWNGLQWPLPWLSN